MKRLFTTGILLTSLFITIGCNEKGGPKVLTKEVSFKKEGELYLKKAINDSIISKLDIEIADNEYETQTGLMYRKSMLVNQGMLFIFDTEIIRAFYMKNTEFALDIIFISGNDEIVSIQKNAKPLDLTSLPSDAPTRYVLEVNAGLSDKWQLQSGDKIEWSALPN